MESLPQANSILLEKSKYDMMPFAEDATMTKDLKCPQQFESQVRLHHSDKFIELMENNTRETTLSLSNREVNKMTEKSGKEDGCNGGTPALTHPGKDHHNDASFHEEDEEKKARESSAEEEVEEVEEVEEEEEEEEEEEGNAALFASDEEALAARAVGIKHYNECRYEDALDIQYNVVRHFEKKYGATASICGPYFLDYGLSQLRLLQSKSSFDAVLQSLDVEALQTCFINLDVARVCFEKQEEERGEEDMALQLQLAEVHNAIAQLYVEGEDFDSALREYECELMFYRFIQEQHPDAVPYRQIAAVLYGIGDCYMKEGDFEGAEMRFDAALEEISTFPPATIAEALVRELEELRDDAREMKGGKFKEIQASIEEQFAVKEAENLPTAQEFYGVTETQELPNKFVSHLREESEYSMLSMPQSLSHPVQWNEHSNSMSLSLFPPQVSWRSPEVSNSQPVYQAVARRKPKPQLPPPSPSSTQQVRVNDVVGAGESDAKRVRTESCS